MRIRWLEFQLWFRTWWSGRLFKQVKRYNRQISRKTRARNEAARMGANHRRRCRELRGEIASAKQAKN